MTEPLVSLRLGRRAPSRPEHQDLYRDLSRDLAGDVRFDDGSRALYATDSSNYRHVPIGLVVPHHVEDIVRTVEVCRRHRVPILPRGAGTSLAGQCCNAAVIMDMTKHVNVLTGLDVEQRWARVQPGMVLDRLREAAHPHRLTFGPDPATHDRCTLGGMIGNNSCGAHAVQAEFYGPGARTADNVQRLEILTYDGTRMWVGPTSDDELRAIIREGGRRGEIHARLRALVDRYGPLIRERFPEMPRRVSGYNLPALLPEAGFNVAQALVGSEATCVTVLEAQLTLIDLLPCRALVVLGYPSVYEAASHIMEIRELKPVAIEGIDQRLIDQTMKKHMEEAKGLSLMPKGHGFLLVEFGANSPAEADEQAHHALSRLRKLHGAPDAKLISDSDQQTLLWKVREAGLGATAFVPGMPDSWPGWEDSAVPPERVAPYLKDFRALLVRHGLEAALYGHFGQGCVHCRITFDMRTEQGIENFRSFTEDAADLVVRYGGSLSGEHGDGQARADLLPKMFGPELMEAFREFKSIWDPEGMMNPGKIVNPHGRTDDLRLGLNYHPEEPPTHFSYQSDHGSFTHAALRCVGVGKCRRESGGTMCPSFMVTHEEEHSTRGRARLLFEMMQGDPLHRGFKEQAVKESLSLCLSCKGCKSDCPVNVDMATYKAEFLAHYYEGRMRPRHAYAFGLVQNWSRLASWFPRLANFATHARGLGPLSKHLTGMAKERELPRFARQSFRHWFMNRPQHTANGSPSVLLWPDTFNNYFRPETLKAALDVLERTGAHVTIPRESLCCGRPLYDYGMLDRARNTWRRTLDALEWTSRENVSIVGLEPSCVAAFRDELPDLMSNDPRSRMLSGHVFTLAEYLDHQGFEPPRLGGVALVHGHCHEKAVLGWKPQNSLLARMGMKLEMPEEGCCGMAGAFGYERGSYPVSVALAERALIPAVRAASDDRWVVADGFSCRQQIEQLSGRTTLHAAEVLQRAMAYASAQESPTHGEHASAEVMKTRGEREREQRT